jgi:hypothetical protein
MKIAGGLEAREAFLFFSSLFSCEGGGAPGGVPWTYRLSATTPVIGGRAACRRSTAVFFSFGVPLFVEASPRPSASQWQGIVVSPGEFPSPPRAWLCEGLAGGTAPRSVNQTPLADALDEWGDWNIILDTQRVNAAENNCLAGRPERPPLSPHPPSPAYKSAACPARGSPAGSCRAVSSGPADCRAATCPASSPG